MIPKKFYSKIKLNRQIEMLRKWKIGSSQDGKWLDPKVLNSQHTYNDVS